MKLRRTIYIGIGGTGIKTVLKVKENFLNSSNGRIPSMIKFLCIDTNRGDLNGKDIDEVRLTELEKVPLFVSRPRAQYNTGVEHGRYNWLPEENNASIDNISGTGAGQVRSNGRFILEYNEKREQAVSSRIQSIYNEMIDETNDDPIYETMPTAKTDVFLAFSIAGGTGSGMFLQVASIIKQVIPNCNLIAYAFSPSFFENVGMNWNITHNAFGAMLELDYHMHGNRPEYKNASMGIEDRLFDAVLYIDNKTHSEDGRETESGFSFEDVLDNVGNALYLSAGQIGTDTASIVDNLKNAMHSGGFDHECRNGMKAGWVSSMGVSEIICVDKADVESKTKQSAINILSDLLNGTGDGNNSSKVSSWIEELGIDESKGDNDGDKLIERILPKSVIESPKGTSLITVDVNGVLVGEDRFKQMNQKCIDDKWVDRAVILSEKETEFINKIKETLFPKGNQTIGLNNLILRVKALKSDIALSESKLQSEIEGLETDEISKNEDIKENRETIKTQNRQFFGPNAGIVAGARRQICNDVLELFSLKWQIERRKEALNFYSDILKIVKSYVDDDGGGKLLVLKQNIVSGLNNLNDYEVNADGVIDKKSVVDLTVLADKLPTAKAMEHPVQDWAELFNETKYNSISDLAGNSKSEGKKDWSEFAIKVFKKSHQEKVTPIILRVLDTLNHEERVSKYKKALRLARPLFEITDFGEIVKRESFVFVSVPYEINEERFDRLKAEFIEAKGENRGIEFIKHRDGNKILVYRQTGVVPPYYLLNMSYSKNGVRVYTSYENKYNEFINSPNHQSYTPFTDVFFKNAYDKEGHSLDSVHNPQVAFQLMDLWVNCFIFELIERKKGLYRMPYSKGNRDLSCQPVKSWKILATSRFEAFRVFENAERDDNAFILELSQKMKKILSEKNNKEALKLYYGGSEESENLYLSKILVDFDSEEYNNDETQQQINKELDFLREHK